MTTTFPSCGYAGEMLAADLRRCTCERIVGVKAVSSRLCAGCYFRSDDNESDAGLFKQLPLWDCLQLGDPIESVETTPAEDILRACGNGHGHTTRRGCAKCPDYVSPVVTPHMTDSQVANWLTAIARRQAEVQQPDQWWQWPNVQSGFRWLCNSAIHRLSKRQPAMEGAGIVIVGGGRYFPSAYVTVRVLRHVGCELPIELWCFRGELDGQQRRLLEAHNVDCVEVDADAAEHGFSFHPTWWKGWQLKPLAIARSRFAEVLYLDADCYPVRDPSYVFQWRTYRELGAVFWPDIASSEFLFKRENAAILGVPNFVDAPTESGQLLIDKRLCWRELEFALFLNQHAEYTYRMLWGDKDTFPLAWSRLGRRFGRMWPTATPHFPAILQHDDRGEVLFQHRAGDKFRLKGTRFDSNHQRHGENRRFGGLQHEDFCFAVLDEIQHLHESSHEGRE